MQTASGGGAPLPLELDGISDDRRVQLEGRRQREMARQLEQQERVAGNGTFRWSPIAMIPAHLCVLIFLVFLLEKLEGSIDWPWATVLSPLWITDAVFIVIKSKEVRKILRMTVHVPSESYALFPPLGGIIDHLGVAAAKVTLAYRLEGKVDWSLLLLFTPMWTCVVLASALRCITPPSPQVMGDQVALHKAGSFFSGLFHLVARGVQPMLIVLKLDGQLDGSWAAVFVPLWIFMGAIALGGTALCCCAPMVSRGVIPEIRPLLIRGMLLCSVGTFSLTFCALLFLVFLTLELDGNEDFPARTILAPLIALYALILVFLPLLLLITRHYVRTMRTVEETFRQAHDPNGVNGPEVSTAGVFPEAAPAATTRNAVPVRATPTILMRESSTLFRRASVSFCRRLGEADGHVLESDLMSLQLADWRQRRRASLARQAGGRGGSGAGGRTATATAASEGGGGSAPTRNSRSFHGLQNILPQAASRLSRRERGFTAAIAGTGSREGRGRFSMSSERQQRAGSEKDASPRQSGGSERASKNERYDRGLLQGDSGTHSVTDSYDLNSYGSYASDDEDGNHEVGLSIDGDDEEEPRGGILDPSLGSTPSPEILLAYGSEHGVTLPAFSLQGGSSSSHGVRSSSHNMSIHGHSSHGFSGHGYSCHSGLGGRRDVASRQGSAVGGMTRVLSWHGGMSPSDAGLEDEEEECEVGVGSEEDMVARKMEAGVLGTTSQSATTCYICCMRPADAVLMECGHSGICYACAQHLAVAPPSVCPVCRHEIQQVLRLSRIVTVRSGGSLVGGSGGGGGGNVSGGEYTSGDELSGGEGSVVAIASSGVGGGGGGVGGGVAGGGGGRASSGSSFARRFSAPDGASAVARAASPPTRDSTRRGGHPPQGMSEEGGWLDPV